MGRVKMVTPVHFALYFLQQTPPFNKNIMSKTEIGNSPILFQDGGVRGSCFSLENCYVVDRKCLPSLYNIGSFSRVSAPAGLWCHPSPLTTVPSFSRPLGTHCLRSFSSPFSTSWFWLLKPANVTLLSSCLLGRNYKQNTLLDIHAHFWSCSKSCLKTFYPV